MHRQISRSEIEPGIILFAENYPVRIIPVQLTTIIKSVFLASYFHLSSTRFHFWILPVRCKGYIGPTRGIQK